MRYYLRHISPLSVIILFLNKVCVCLFNYLILINLVYIMNSLSFLHIYLFYEENYIKILYFY